MNMGLTSVKTLAKRILTLQFATRNKIFSVPEGHGTRSKLCLTGLLHQSYSSSAPLLGFDEFFEVKKPNEVVSTGRSWTCVDLRRKSFEDLHRLWFILYKERNLLLTDREKSRRNGRPVARVDENRYIKVKRSMAAIKQVLHERRRIRYLIGEKGDELTAGSLPEDASTKGESQLRGEMKPGYRHPKTSPFAHLSNYGRGENRKHGKR